MDWVLRHAKDSAAWGPYGERCMFRAQEIAAVDRAQRILRGEGTSRLWMSLARRFLSHTRRERVVWFLWSDDEV